MTNGNIGSVQPMMEASTPGLFAGLSGRYRKPMERQAIDAPLVVAIHGGTYSSAYFDLHGYSLLDRAASVGIPIIAVDRPGYGDSAMLPASEQTLRGQARFLSIALEDAWTRFGGSTNGIVLIGHSIGAAIAALIASEPCKFPLLGLAISGVCLRTPPHFQGAWASLPDTPLVDLPVPLKDEVMFGPPGSFDASMPEISHQANTTVPKVEILDIVSTWPAEVQQILPKINVPVHYRQAEVDHLWIVDQEEIRGFKSALSQSPRVDAEMMRATGHCMDFHRIGAALQLQQLGFALQCAIEKKG